MLIRFGNYTPPFRSMCVSSCANHLQSLGPIASQSKVGWVGKNVPFAPSRSCKIMILTRTQKGSWNIAHHPRGVSFTIGFCHASNFQLPWHVLKIAYDSIYDQLCSFFLHFITHTESEGWNDLVCSICSCFKDKSFFEQPHETQQIDTWIAGLLRKLDAQSHNNYYYRGDELSSDGEIHFPTNFGAPNNGHVVS